MQLPDEFLAQTLAAMGEERFGRFLAAFDAEPPVSIRLNPAKIAGGSVPRVGTPVPWCPLGYYLASRPQFTFDPLLHAGCYYVQEAASMFVHHIVSELIRRPVLMLDLCAAPGGKSTALLSALPEGSVLVSNEPVRQRAQVLVENIVKWGYDDSIVTCNYPRDYRQSGLFFDAMLCDVPCSGEGMFRKDPACIGEWSLQNVERCWQLQRQIVADAWQCLRPGGCMIYSTCTYNIKENEENVRWMCTELGAQVVPVGTEAEWGITGSLLEGFSEPVYRFIPGLTQSEGLFVCVLRKAGEADTAAPQRWDGRRLNVLYDGKPQPVKRGKDVLPSHAEALKATFRPGRYPAAEVDYRQAIAYLRHESLALPADTPRGMVVIMFGGRPLGFAKNIGNRANNLYPQEWKIKSTHIPEDYETIFRPA